MTFAPRRPLVTPTTPRWPLRQPNWRRQSDVVVVAVVNDEQVRAVLSGPEGVLAAGVPGTTVVVVSTITTACVAAIGAEAAALGVPIIDCGVSGGPSAAASGNLVCMCGGDPEVIAGLAPLFEAIGSLTVTMGPFGTGLAAKLARNVVQYGGWLAAYEGQVLAEAAGIELAKLALVVRASDAQSGGPSNAYVPAKRWRHSPMRTTKGWSEPCRPRLASRARTCRRLWPWPTSWISSCLWQP